MVTGVQQTRGNHVESLQDVGKVNVLITNQAGDTEVPLHTS